MEGEETKYYKYETSTSGTVTIPKAMAKGLGWKLKDTILALFKAIEGHEGLFLYKKKEENVQG